MATNLVSIGTFAQESQPKLERKSSSSTLKARWAQQYSDDLTARLSGGARSHKSSHIQQTRININQLNIELIIELNNRIETTETNTAHK